MPVGLQTKLLGESYEIFYYDALYPNGGAFTPGAAYSKNHVIDAINAWVDHRNKICHRPGYLATICLSKFQVRSQYILHLLDDLLMAASGALTNWSAFHIQPSAPTTDFSLNV